MSRHEAPHWNERTVPRSSSSCTGLRKNFPTPSESAFDWARPSAVRITTLHVAELPSGHHWHHQIQQHHARPLLAAQVLQRLLPVPHAVDLVSRVFHCLAERFAQIRVIFDE